MLSRAHLEDLSFDDSHVFAPCLKKIFCDFWLKKQTQTNFLFRCGIKCHKYLSRWLACTHPCHSWEVLSKSSPEARWKYLLQHFSAPAGNVGSVALVLTINGASLLNRPCQTMQHPAESRDEDMGLQWSLAVPTSYQWQQASILAALSPGPCQAWLQQEEKMQKPQAAGIKQRLDYPLNMSHSGTIHLWIPMVQSGRNVIIFILGWCWCSKSPPLSNPGLVCRIPSVALRELIKFEIKSNPVASILTQSKIHHLTL